MGYLRFNYRSEALGRDVDVSIVYPTDKYGYLDTRDGTHPVPGLGKPKTHFYQPGMKFKTVYLIHGGGDDDSLTYRYTNVERYAQDYNVMLVTPNVTNSFGADTNYGVNYCTFLTQELPVVVQALFASSPKREDNFIMGYAMGGNVALSCALRAPEKYGVCVDLSGGIGYTLDTAKFQTELDSDHFRNNFCLYNHTFGPSGDLPGSRHDLRAIAQQKLDEGGALPRFYLAYGSEEGFIGERVAQDAKLLKEMGFDVTCSREEGFRHDFDFWDTVFPRIFREVLPLEALD